MHRVRCDCRWLYFWSDGWSQVYNREVRLHKLVYEAFTRLVWKGFLSWLQANNTNDVVHMDETLKTISKLCKGVSQESLKQIFQNRSCACITYLYEVYLEFLQVGNGSLSTFYLSYLDMVEILLGLLRASREGHWMLHLASICATIPWCFTYDRHNYARCLPYYYAQMTQLPVEHPYVHALCKVAFQFSSAPETLLDESLSTRQLRKQLTKTPKCRVEQRGSV